MDSLLLTNNIEKIEKGVCWMKNKRMMYTVTLSIVLFTTIFTIIFSFQRKNDLVEKDIESKFALNSTNFNITSSFNLGDTIPLKYVCSKISGGNNISIPIQWADVPIETKSFAVLMYDPHPVAKNFVHWAVVNITNTVSQLQEGASLTANMPTGSIELKNSSGSAGYIGPCPPVGTGKHEYKIIVYALNVDNLNLSGFVPFSQFQSAINGKVLAQTELSGYFEQ